MAFLPVIASAAKQSSAALAMSAGLDCFVASLLAMTRVGGVSEGKCA